MTQPSATPSLSLQVALAALEKPWPQNPLMQPNEFVSYAKERGFWISEENLETWERLGIFLPVVKAWRPFSYHVSAGRKQGLLNWYQEEFDGIPTPEQRGEAKGKIVKIYRERDSQREKREFYVAHPELLVLPDQKFVEWKEFHEGRETIGYILYHPFQIFRLQHILRLLKQNCSLSNFTAPEELLRHVQADLKHALAALKTSLDESLGVLLLLLRIEDKYLPDFRGARPLRHIVGEGHPFEEFDIWNAAFSAQDVRQKSNLSIEQIEKMRNDVAHIGRDVRP